MPLHVLLDRYLFEFLLSLTLEFVQVIGHSSVVLIRPSNGWLIQLFFWRLHLKNGFLNIILDEILLLARL